MNRLEFSKALLMLGEIFNTEVNKLKIDIYYEILKDYSDEEIKKALNIVMRTCRFFPKPAEIIEIVEGKKDERLALIWERVKEVIRNYGAYESIAFEDRIVNQTIEALGGWVSLCSTPVGEMKWKQREFERLYRIFENKNIEEMPKYVMGITEQNNRQLGIEGEFKGIVDGGLRSLKVKEFIKRPIMIKMSKPDIKQIPVCKNLHTSID